MTLVGREPATRWVGWALAAAFVLWNGWTLCVMAHHGTGILPGGTTVLVLEPGPFAFSRNPLHVGLVALDVAIALLAPVSGAPVALTTARA